MGAGTLTIVRVGILAMLAHGEVTPTNTPLPATKFQCTSGKIIPVGWRCDREDDCGDNSDEEDCLRATCKGSEFHCGDGNCIPMRWICDKDSDCKDGSDEAQDLCNSQTCGPDKFGCNSGTCIPSNWVCDGQQDCGVVGEDETNCTSTCEGDEYRCDNGQCIAQRWKCDGDKDCKDGSDEDKCGNTTCARDQIMCLEQRVCLSKSVQCDGSKDCKDGSDELNCSASYRCNGTDFHCGHGVCIDKSLVCDGTSNCKNMEDENLCAHNQCSDNNGGCDHICVSLSGNKRKCDCNPGYTLMNDSQIVCTDIDECKDNQIHGTCSQICKNTKGGYKCECVNNYSLVNKRYCKAGGGNVQLLLSQKRDLRRINLETFAYNLLLGDGYMSSAVAMDFDFLGNRFYWTDVAREGIFRAYFGNKSSVEEVASTDVRTPDGLAVDWINKHLYWTDTGFDRIEVSSLDGKMRKTLINTGLDEPRAIVLDPNHGLMYWTDWGEQPKIERCGMDGNDRKVIINTTIAWPNGLTIDYVADRLYWVDSKLHSIESSNTLGLERVSVLQSHLHLRHPFAITVFEDYLYWTDWTTSSVSKYSKFGRRDAKVMKVETVVKNLNTPMGVRVFHPYRQQILRRLCGTDKGGCSHFCLPKAYDPSNTELYVCDCPNGFVLSSDRKNCGEGAVNATTVGPTPPSSGTVERKDIECTAVTMDIHIPRTLLPTHNVTLRDPTCVVPSNGTHLVISISFNQCGTTVSFSNDTVVFSNELVATVIKASHPTSIVDYGLSKDDQRVSLECVYKRHSSVELNYMPMMRAAHFYEKRYGNLDFEVKRYTDEQFTTEIANTDIPTGVNLNSEIFIDLVVDQHQTKDIGIYVPSCFATPTPSPTDPLFYPLIRSSCPAQADVRRFTAPDINEFRFSFLAFKFTRAPMQKPHASMPAVPMVYIHCQVSACPRGNCTSSCNSANGGRMKRAALGDSSHLISTGPFFLKTDESTTGYSSIVVAVTMSVAVAATVVAMAAIVAWRRSASKLSAYKSLRLNMDS